MDTDIPPQDAPPQIPTTIESLLATREKVVPGPSGNVYRITFVNLQRHALSGELPATLRRLALQGAAALNRLFASDDGTISEEGLAVRTYLDRLVGQVILEPRLLDENGDPLRLPEPVTLPDGRRLELAVEALPAVDYKWALEVAFMEEDRDGIGRRLWGREPLSMWATFRKFHNCDEDCSSCGRTADAFSAGG